MSTPRIIATAVLVTSFFGCIAEEPPPRSAQTKAAVTGDGTASTGSVDANKSDAGQTPPAQPSGN
jgi:hypothetical protein